MAGDPLVSATLSWIWPLSYNGPMNIIERDALKARIDRGDDFKLVMVLSAWAFEAKHIPGSIDPNLLILHLLLLPLSPY